MSQCPLTSIFWTACQGKLLVHDAFIHHYVHIIISPCILLYCSIFLLQIVQNNNFFFYCKPKQFNHILLYSTFAWDELLNPVWFLFRKTENIWKTARRQLQCHTAYSQPHYCYAYAFWQSSRPNIKTQCSYREWLGVCVCGGDFNWCALIITEACLFHQIHDADSMLNLQLKWKWNTLTKILIGTNCSWPATFWFGDWELKILRTEY